MRYMLVFALCIPYSFAAEPSPQELQEAREWVAAKFEGQPQAAVPVAGIEVISNHDPVQANARNGKPMNITGQTYTRGLYCHAESLLHVRLPKPARTFEAVVGVDSNDQTSGGRGSVVFSVRTSEADLWNSGIMREGDSGKAVAVELGGVSELWLAIDDAGDGISCDQSDWAEARVTLADGDVVWLGELPIQGSMRAAYSSEPFFAFDYGGKPSAEFLADWTCDRVATKLDDARVRHTITYSDPDTGLAVRCEGIAYLDFPTVEWTLYFKNSGTTNTPILSAIQAIDTTFDCDAASDFTLYHNKGDNCTADSYEPLVDALPHDSDLRIANTGGRPTQTSFPYFNINRGDDGLIFVVSWAGQWAAQFKRDDAMGLTLRAGQELTHFTLRPGEEVRTPLIVLQFYKGDRVRAQNVWRSWMIEHNLPRPGGNLPKVPLLAACSSHQYGEMINADSASQELFITKYLERGITIDYWWMDAGWYWNKTGWPNTGTWEVDTNRFPGGLRPISDFAHAKNVDIIVWFEPERVTADTWLSNNHPEWIHGGAKGGLLDLGNADARAWLIDHVDGLLTDEGIDLYRQDFNMDPLSYWRGNDAEDRQGITEIRHVEGYFAYWDALRERHPDLLIDSCASGGRRNDLETLRRAVPFLRSDYIMEPVGNQCHTWALASWFPYFGTGSSKTDSYLIRSTLGTNFIACWDQRDDGIDWNRIKSVIDEWKSLAPNFYGDYYPVTNYSLDHDQWIAWQFDRPDHGTGMVQAFRREDSIYESARLPLHGLDPNARYSIQRDTSGDASESFTGKELMDSGLPVAIKDKPGAIFIGYVKD